MTKKNPFNSLLFVNTYWKQEIHFISSIELGQQNKKIGSFFLTIDLIYCNIYIYIYIYIMISILDIVKNMLLQLQSINHKK